MAKKLTTADVMRAKAGKDRQEIADGGSPGLYLVIQPRPSGHRSWALRYRSPIERDKRGHRKAKKLTLGPVDIYRELEAGEEWEIDKPLSLSGARMLAAREMDRVKRKIDPIHFHREAMAQTEAVMSASFSGPSVEGAFVEFLKRYPLRRGKKSVRESTRRQTAGYLGLKPDPKHAGEWIATGSGVLARWRGKPIATLTKRDTIILLESIGDSGATVSANRTLTALKLFGTWAVDREYLPANPFATIKAQFEEKERERVLDDAEIVALWRVCEAEGFPYGSIPQLVLLTAQRPGEVREAPWAEFKLDDRGWIIPGDRTKNGREHLVPLSDMATDILEKLPRKGEGIWVFTTSGDRPASKQSRVKRRLDKLMLAELRKRDPEASLEPWTYHDLRRTAYSGFQSLGFPVWIADAVTNHTLQGMAKVYGKYDYAKEKRVALEAWARHVEGIVRRPLLTAPVPRLAPPNVEIADAAEPAV